MDALCLGIAGNCTFWSTCAPSPLLTTRKCKRGEVSPGVPKSLLLGFPAQAHGCPLPRDPGQPPPIPSSLVPRATPGSTPLGVP